MRKILEIGKSYPEITGSAAVAFMEEVNRVAAQPEITELILNMNGTRIINSMAMASLFLAYQNLADREKCLRIVNPSPRIVHLLRLAAMDGILAPGENTRSE
jgi:anti-anti-sigma factor